MTDPTDEKAGEGVQGQQAEQRRSPLETGDDFSKYEIQSRTEIVFILNAIKDTAALTTVYFNQGRDFLLTSLLNVSPAAGTMVLDVGSSNEMNRRALRADRLTCISSHNKVRIQFVLDGIDPVKFEGRNAFLGNIPETLVRLQRRDYYRLATPVAKPLVCRIPGEQGNAPIAANVVDISGGGIALIVPPEMPEIETDQELTDCRIDLPDIGTIVVSMRVRNMHDTTLPNGRILRRCGCQFLNLQPPMATMIQKYIIQIDRERKARERGQ